MSERNNVVNLSTQRAKRDGTGREFCGLVSMPNAPRDFVLGVEVGILMARLDAKPHTWRGTYHAENKVLIERTAAAYGYTSRVESSADPNWLFVEFFKL